MGERDLQLSGSCIRKAHSKNIIQCCNNYIYCGGKIFSSANNSDMYIYQILDQID